MLTHEDWQGRVEGSANGGELVSKTVLILGTGAAGMRAAIELRRSGIRAIAVSKGAASASGATPSALYSYCCGREGDPQNSPERFREDVLRSGLSVNDPDLVELLARDGFPRLEDLTEMGMPWTRAEGGDYDLGMLPGHSAPRAFHVGRSTGRALTATLTREGLKAGVEFLQYHVALDLIMRNGKVAGAILLDLVSGQAVFQPCGAVVIATGGFAGVFGLNTNPPGATGDGLAMVLRAGGELADMEFMQMYPTVLVAPPRVAGMEIPTSQILSADAKLLNRDKEEFFGRWEKVPVGQATRDVLARAIAREIHSGGGTDAGGVYLDARNVRLDLNSDRYIRFLKVMGVDPTADLQEVAPGAHYSLGGIRVTAPCSCPGLEGVFAAGEVVSGVHGANRLAGNALTETQVFGAAAGRAAAQYLSREGCSREDCSPTQCRPPERGESRLYDGLCDAGERGTGQTPFGIRERLTKVMDRYAATIRTSESLTYARNEIASLREEFRTSVGIPSPKAGESWFPRLLQYVETANMLSVAEALVISGLVRPESRGSHYRDDFPGRDSAWDGRNVVTRMNPHGESLEVFIRDRASGERRQVDI